MNTAANQPTVGKAFEASLDGHSNNFLLLRLLAAALVIYGHSFVFTENNCSQCYDLVKGVLGYRYAGDLGVAIFFTISGFLVSASLQRRSSLISFALARALRLFPGLIVFILIVSIIAGPLISAIPIPAYFGSPSLFRFIWVNGTLFGYEPELPGVLANTRFPSLAGTLWTLWIEARLYVLVAVIGIAGLLNRPALVGGVVLAGVMIALVAPSYFPLIGVTPEGTRLAGFFAAGMLVFVYRDHIPLRKDLLAVFAIVAVLSRSLPSYEWTCDILVVYSTFIVALSEKVPFSAGLGDCSYGMYLYGWLIQRLFIFVWPQHTAEQLFLVSLPLSVLCGVLSWQLIEKRALRLKIRPSDLSQGGEVRAAT